MGSSELRGDCDWKYFKHRIAETSRTLSTSRTARGMPNLQRLRGSLITTFEFEVTSGSAVPALIAKTSLC
jgi:hypothetical protein